MAGAAFAYYRFVYLRRSAAVEPGEGQEALLADDDGDAARAEQGEPDAVQPAALDFGDETSAAAGAALDPASPAQGWGQCFSCQAPCKKGWPRCPSCKSKLSLTEAGAQAEDEDDGDAASALDNTAPCWKCQAPVRSSWPRCPGCKAERQQPGEQSPEAGAATSAAGPESPSAPFAPDKALQGGEAAAALDPAFISECWRCQAPVKLSWSVCPGCKAPTTKPADLAGDQTAAGGSGEDDALVAAERAAAGFAVECEKCHAPVKPEWPRCPGCKHPIPKPAQPPDAPAADTEASEAGAPAAAATEQ